MATYYLVDGKVGICYGLSMNKHFIKEEPEVAPKMLHSHVDSIKYIYTHPYETAEIFAKYYKVSVPVALKTIYMKCVHEGRTLTWKMERDKIQHAMDTIVKYIPDEKLGTLDEITDYEFYEKCDLPDVGKQPFFV